MGQGNYDHPSYLTRQMIVLGRNTAGNGTTTQLKAFPLNVRLRKVQAMVVTAGTSAGATVALYAIGTGTTFTSAGVGTTFTTTATLGTATQSSDAAGTQYTLASDANIELNAGNCRLVAINGTDATGVMDLIAEGNVDPAASWTGNG